MKLVNPFYAERIPEWMNASIMILAAIQVFLLSDINTAEGYFIFTWVGLSKVVPIVFMGIVGIARIVALYINGAWKRTPMIRGVGAAVSAVYFTLITFGGYLPAIVLAVADVYAAYRAGYDARAVNGARNS